MKKILLYIGFWLVSLTWGCIMTAIGLVAAIILLITGHKPHLHGPSIYFEVGTGWGGIELGAFFITCKNASERTRCHELGHGLQNLIWGPLMPFVICIPSAARYWYREWIYHKDKEKYRNLPDYDAIWFEGQATSWGKSFAEKFIYN